MKVGDKVTVLPFDELDVEECDVTEYEVFGIGRKYYDEYVGNEYIIGYIDTTDSMNTCSFIEGDYISFDFPIGCIKKLQ